jgi:hypothetical protein
MAGRQQQNASSAWASAGREGGAAAARGAAAAALPKHWAAPSDPTSTPSFDPCRPDNKPGCCCYCCCSAHALAPLSLALNLLSRRRPPRPR